MQAVTPVPVGIDQAYGELLRLTETHPRISYGELDAQTLKELRLFGVPKDEYFKRIEESLDQIIRALPQIRRVLDAWPFATTPKQQNALLRSILSRIDYTKTTRCQRNESAADHITLSLSFLDTHASE